MQTVPRHASVPGNELRQAGMQEGRKGNSFWAGPRLTRAVRCNYNQCAKRNWRSVSGRTMLVLRRITAWVVLATYLSANTLASSWHDHGDCCHASAADHHHHHDEA